MTVITPVFDAAGRDILFFVANRGHHADIGGITPGSTPPVSRTLEEEGVVLDNFLLVDGGHFREAEFRDLLASATYPARSPDVNVADIKAQIAANEKGVQELRGVVARFGWEVVRAYMRHVMDNAEESVRRVIDRIGDGSFAYTMDDGSPLQVAFTVDHARAHRDDRLYRHRRPARRQLQRAAGGDPLGGALCAALSGRQRHPAERRLPEADPAGDPARHLPVAPAGGGGRGRQHRDVASRCQRAVRRSRAVACSQATMNNFIFGDATRQYYETICGGAGAGPGFDGASAVHTHMTNTRMTDPEVLELRYPVRLEEFSIRRGSGGAGAGAAAMARCGGSAFSSR